MITINSAIKVSCLQVLKQEENGRLLAHVAIRAHARCKLGECRAEFCLYGVWNRMNSWQRYILKHAELIKPFLTCAVEDASQWFDGRTYTAPRSL